MKTAKEIFMEIQDIECPNVNNLTLPEEWQLKAMKIYANQKLDEAASKIKYNPILKEAILSLKDKL